MRIFLRYKNHKEIKDGCDIVEFEKSVRESSSYRLGGKEMVVASLMSDAQEEISMGLVDKARQTLNRAKYILTNN